MRRTVTAISVLMLATGASMPVLACGPMATVRFQEGSPWDRFEIVNNSSGDWQVVQLDLLLDGSAGRLIFDTAGGGPGASMHQPFAADPSDFDARVPAMVADGDTMLRLAFAGFGPRAHFSFTIDVDDTLLSSGAGRMRVTDSEIEGAQAKALFSDPAGHEMALEGQFGPDGIAIVSGLACS